MNRELLAHRVHDRLNYHFRNGVQIWGFRMRGWLLATRIASTYSLYTIYGSPYLTCSVTVGWTKFKTSKQSLLEVEMLRSVSDCGKEHDNDTSAIGDESIQAAVPEFDRNPLRNQVGKKERYPSF